MLFVYFVDPLELSKRLDFLRAVEPFKQTLRSAHTSSGRKESAAEHTWRLSLMILTFADQFEGLDLLKLLKMVILHDLGETIHGDIPAPEQGGAGDKAGQERADFQSLIESLPPDFQAEFLELWDDYEYVRSPEAKVAKAFDKLETLLQHTQGKNPADFDYGFNLNYGTKYTAATPLTQQIRDVIDEATRERMG